MGLNRVETFNLFHHYNFPLYIFFFSFYFLLPWPLCNSFYNGAFNHYCRVLRSSLGNFFGVLPLQFNDLLEFDPLFKYNLALRSLIFFTSNLFFALVGASASSSFFTEHTSPTSCFLCGSLRNRILSSDDGAHHAILWNGIHGTMFSIPFFSK